jgi:hypothetical protein
MARQGRAHLVTQWQGRDRRQVQGRPGLRDNVSSTYYSSFTGGDQATFLQKQINDGCLVKISAAPPLYCEVSKPASKTCNKRHDTKVGLHTGFLPTARWPDKSHVVPEASHESHLGDRQITPLPPKKASSGQCGKSRHLFL